MSKRAMREKVENGMEDTRGYENSGVRCAGLTCHDLTSLILHTASGLVPAVSQMVNSLAYMTLVSPSSS